MASSSFSAQGPQTTFLSSSLAPYEDGMMDSYAVDRHAFDTQLELSDNLCILRGVHPSHTQSLSTGMRAEHGVSTTTNILSWIAQCFVKEEQGEVFASALCVTAGAATLHIAKNSGLPCPVDQEFGAAFMARVSSFVNRRLAGERNNDQQEVDEFVRMSLRHSWVRIKRKLRLIGTKMELPQEAAECQRYISDLIDIWANFISRRFKCEVTAAERSVRILRIANKLHRGGSVDVLKDIVFQVIVGGFRVATDEQAFNIRYKEFTHIIDCAQMLLESDFLKAPLADDEWHTQIGPTNVQCLLRLRRRLERITLYRTGAEYFVRHGMSLFTKVTPSAQRVNVGLQWVGNVPEPGGPPFTLREYFRRGRRHTTMNYVPVKIAASPVHIHPEVALVHHLDALGIHAFRGAIGVSKAPCWACVHYLECLCRAAGLQKQPWHLPETGKKVQPAWRVPKALPGAAVLDMDVVNCAVDYLVKRAREKRAKC
ncbi:hypothetical protein A0H81_07983 [Grifola frondosa]|uniref:Uncharacterized protein n=1 Tax=Grifola frondosa TaxID=5627 RepID=A0A1C7M6A2_GRIFR|nr:hypothetical protein A0H81_07983 [Grifola frondosa]